jgi:hypothetical protein
MVKGGKGYVGTVLGKYRYVIVLEFEIRLQSYDVWMFGRNGEEKQVMMKCIERGIGVGILNLYLTVLTYRTWHHNACDNDEVSK